MLLVGGEFFLFPDEFADGVVIGIDMIEVEIVLRVVEEPL
jgi:hypothetical protein